MRYRSFGRTGLEVSELVFGGGAVGGILIDADDDTRRAAIRQALDAGINWIDTAALYGNGRSEQALGWLLAEIDATPYVSTKVMLDLAAGDIAGQIEASLVRSLTRLRRDSVTLFQLHNPIAAASTAKMVSPREITRSGGVLDTLERLRSQGLFDHLGITALGEAPAIIEVLDTGRVASAQVYYNLLNPSAGRALPTAYEHASFAGVLAACERNGAAAMCVRVLSAGVLATDARHGREGPLTAGDTVESETAKAKAMQAALGDAHGTRAQAAIRFALGEPRLSCVIVGLAELAHLHEALDAQAMGSLPADALERIEAVYAMGATRAPAP
ncbi:MAG: aldo/keto reductase [Burkholderiaceae bacterium]